jgi:hypothetical protein
LPNNCLGARKVTIESHLVGLLDEISRREKIQIEENDDEDLPGEDAIDKNAS